MADLCGPCGATTRGSRSTERELRGRECPRFGAVHHACCALQECSRVNARGAVLCEFVRWNRAQVPLGVPRG